MEPNTPKGVLRTGPVLRTLKMGVLRRLILSGGYNCCILALGVGPAWSVGESNIGR